MPSSITRRNIMMYAALALPVSFVGLPIYLNIPDLYSTKHGMSLATIGIMLLIIRFIDAFQDPLIGYYAKRVLQNRDRIKPLFISAFIVLAASFYCLLNPLDIMPISIWFLLFMIICTTAYSVIVIIYNSLGAVWESGYDERTKITSTREGFGLVGIIIAAITPTILTQITSSDDVYFEYFILFLVLLVAAAALWFRWLADAKFSKQLSGAQAGNFFAIIRQGKLAPFYAIWLLSQIASAIPVVLVIFFVRDGLGLENLTGLFLLIYFLSGVVAMPFWQIIQKFTSKKMTWQIAMLVAVSSFFWAYFLQAGDAVNYAIICALSGFALGAELAIPPSILADRIERAGAESGSTIYFALAAFISKFALAVASGIMLPILAYYGFQPDADNDKNALSALSVSYALVPCLMKLAALTFLYYSNIEEKHEEKNKY